MFHQQIQIRKTKIRNNGTTLFSIFTNEEEIMNLKYSLRSNFLKHEARYFGHGSTKKHEVCSLVISCLRESFKNFDINFVFLRVLRVRCFGKDIRFGTRKAGIQMKSFNHKGSKETSLKNLEIVWKGWEVVTKSAGVIEREDSFWIFEAAVSSARALPPPPPTYQ